jgi:hypothetical protein
MNKLLARHESSYIYSNSEVKGDEYVLNDVKSFRSGELAHEYMICSVYENHDLTIAVMSEEKMYTHNFDGDRLFGGQSTGLIFERLFPV